MRGSAGPAAWEGSSSSPKYLQHPFGMWHSRWIGRKRREPQIFPKSAQIILMERDPPCSWGHGPSREQSLKDQELSKGEMKGIMEKGEQHGKDAKLCVPQQSRV